MVEDPQLDPAAEKAFRVLGSTVNAADLAKQVFPPLSWAVPGVIPEGLAILAGAPKAGKSWFVLSVALGIAAGGDVLGAIPVEQRPVLYFALEDGFRRLQGRMRELLQGQEPPKLLEFQIDVHPSELRPAVEHWLRMNPSGVVILDTFGRVRPAPRPNEAPYQADYAAMSALKKLTDDQPGSSFVVVHHTRKAVAGDFLERVSGSQGLAGAADSTLVLSRERGQDGGLLEVTGRDVPEASYALIAGLPGSWQLDGADLEEAAQRASEVQVTAGVGDRMTEVIAYVNRATGAVSPSDVAVALDLPNDQAGVYLRRAAEKGRIRKVGRGSYTPVLSVRSVRMDDHEGSEQNTQNTKNTPPVRRNCRVCAFPLDSALGDADTHPNCEESA